VARLVVVSNRVASPRERGARAGGLAVAMREALARAGGLWIGWSGETAEDATARAPTVETVGAVDHVTFDLTPDEYAGYYVGFANSTLWPLFHYRLSLVEYSRAAWQAYRAVNARVARLLAEALRPGDIVWVQDYHFLTLADELRRLGVTHRIGFFLHIPFPAPEALAVLPPHREIGRALMAYDLIGLQTPRDAGALRRYLLDEAQGTALDRDRISAYERTATVRAFPIGIDTDGFARMATKAESAPETLRLVASLAGRRLVIGVDRLDYSKGLPARLRAFEGLLASHPDWRAKVTMMQIAPVSRGEVQQYRAQRRELESLAGRINGRYAEFDWVPVRYLNESFSRRTLSGFYRVASVGLVTPLRDGMNLVAKEYVAAQRPDDPGVLVLSEFAGAAAELDAAVIVNPFDQDAMTEALAAALAMPREERIARWRAAMDRLRANTIGHWRDAFLAALVATDPAVSARAPVLI